VTYVVQRFTSLATLLYLLAVVLYARWRLAREEGRARGLAGAALYAGVLASALLAMKTKEIAITLPAAIALYEVAFFDGPWRRRLAALAPIMATVVVIPLAMVSLHKPVAEILADASEATVVQTSTPRQDYLATQLVVPVRYLRLLVLPVGQNLDYDFPVYRSFLAPAVAGSALLLSALAAAGAFAWGGPFARWSRRSRDPATRLAGFGVAWFFVASSVESSVIPIADVIFEHRMYLPSVGLFTAAATAGALAARRLSPSRWPAALVAAGAAASAILAVATWNRNEVWATNLSLWTDVVAKSPGKSRAQDNLGLAYAHLDRTPEAAARFQEAVRLDRTNIRALNNLGVALAKLGHLPESKEALEAALALAPTHAESLYNLGRLYLMYEGRFAEAATLFQAAIRQRPDYPEAYAALGAAWNQLGRYGDTVTVLGGASDLIRDQPHARFNLGLALALTGDGPGAEREVRALQALSPELADQLVQYLRDRLDRAGDAGAPR
jgi:Flp pilus assembly protein TadD